MRGTAWTPDDKARACAMRDGGKTCQQIADALGCERERVGSLFRRGIPPKRLRQSTVKQRNCLGCGIPFLSEWEGNRQCPRCSVMADSENEDYAAAV